jgi:hypothetical protein
MQKGSDSFFFLYSLLRRRSTEMIGTVLIALLVLAGPLALVFGVDSRRDEGRHGWPSERR